MVTVVVGSLPHSVGAADRLFPGGSPWPVLPVVIIGLGVGALAGLINGTLVAKAKIPAWVLLICVIATHVILKHTLLGAVHLRLREQHAGSGALRD